MQGGVVQGGVVRQVTNSLEFKELMKAIVNLSSTERKNIKVAR